MVGLEQAIEAELSLVNIILLVIMLNEQLEALNCGSCNRYALS